MVKKKVEEKVEIFWVESEKRRKRRKIKPFTVGAGYKKK